MPAGWAGIDLFVLAIFAWAEPTFGNIYYGNALRAFELAVGMIKNKASVPMTRSMAHHAEVQHTVAEMALDLEGIAVSTGSACSSGTLEPSHVLKAMGFPPHRTQNSIRFSLGAANTEAEVDRAVAVLPGIVEKLRNLIRSPVRA